MASTVWIRLDAFRHTSPGVGGLARALGVGRFEAVGLLTEVWAYYWDNKAKGSGLLKCSRADLDHVVGRDGFASVLEGLGVIQVLPSGIKFLDPELFICKRIGSLTKAPPPDLFAPEEVEATALVPVDDPVVIEMPKKVTAKSPGKIWVFRKSQMESLKAKYPGMDVEASVHRFASWYKLKEVSPRIDWMKTLDGWVHSDYARVGLGRATQQQREDEKVSVMAEAYSTKGAKEMAKVCDARAVAIRGLEDLEKRIGLLPMPDRVRLAAYKAGLVPGQEFTEAGLVIVKAAKEQLLIGDKKSGEAV